MAPVTYPLSFTESDRDNPSSSFIETMREWFPTEREIDRMLSREMQRCPGPCEMADIFCLEYLAKRGNAAKA
jgi:hypothetical protein